MSENTTSESNKEEKVELLTYEEIVTNDLSKWRARMAERLYQYEESVSRRLERPTQMVPVQNGEMPISKIVELRWHSLVEATSAVKVLEEYFKLVNEKGENELFERAQELSKNEPSFIEVKSDK